MLENPGVISSTVNPTTGKPNFPNLSDVQLDYLTAALTRVKTDKFAGAVLIAVHHPPYTFGKHTGSHRHAQGDRRRLPQTGVWPHAILSGHAHNYQRFTRTLPVGKTTRQIPFLVIGNGGHGLTPLSGGTAAAHAAADAHLRPARAQRHRHLRELRRHGLRLRPHPGRRRPAPHRVPPRLRRRHTKTPNDAVTVDLATGTITTYTPAA